MNTGKLAPQNDPRMPNTAPDQAPDSTHKPMPELPLDTKELRYPPDDQLTGEDTATSTPAPSGTPAEAVSEVPRKQPPIAPAAVTRALGALSACIVECEKFMERGPGVSTRGAEEAALAELCAATCRLATRYLNGAEQRDLQPLVIEAGLLCARMCETCALACEHHVPDAEHARLIGTCRSCAEACRALAV